MNGPYYLNDKDRTTIATALKIALDTFRQYRLTFANTDPRLSEQFGRQAEDTERLLQELE